SAPPGRRGHAEPVMNPRQPHSATARPSSQRALPRRSVMTGALIAGPAFAAACVRPTNATAAAEPTDPTVPTASLTWGWQLPTTWDSARGIGYDVHVLSLVSAALTRLS